MPIKHATGLLLALRIASTTVPVPAQTTGAPAAAPQSREQVRMETREFLRTHRWDEVSDTWLLKSGIEPPTGVVSRAVVKAQRDEYMRNNRWDEARAVWVPRQPVLPAVSSLTREQEREITIAFMRTHHWSEEKETWLLNPASGAK